MKYKLWPVLLLCAVLLSACSARETPPTTVPVTTAPVTAPTTKPATIPTTVPPTESATTAPPPVTVYAGAVKDYLFPVTEYSWERTEDPEFVVIHFTSAVVTHPEDPYAISHVRQTFLDYDVSIHYLIDRDGTVYCYIPEDRAAWHAGAGEYLNDPKYTNKMNLYSIGIELVGIGSQADMSQYLTKAQYKKLDPSLPGFTDAQYSALETLVSDLCFRYEIPMDRTHILGHEDYASRKTDPGELFDWSRILP